MVDSLSMTVVGSGAYVSTVTCAEDVIRVTSTQSGFRKVSHPNEISPSQEHPHPDDQTTRFNSRLSALKLNGGKCILAAFYVQDG